MKGFSKVRRFGAWGTGLLAALALAGCGGHDHDAHGDAGHSGHAHEAPHGGALAMLGNHAFQIEVVPDGEAGTVSLYILDGEAERFVRIGAEAIEATLALGERSERVSFLAIGNEATGETIGDTALFQAEAPNWAGEPRFQIRVDRLELRGQVYEGIEIPYPEGRH